MKDDCLFCKLANGVYPSNTIYEDDLFRVIIDIGPAAKGHALIIPKNHMEDLMTILPEEAESILFLAQKVACAMKKALHCDGINLLQNSGEAAWQTIFHFHMHLVPRYKDDNLIMPGPKQTYAEGEADKYAAAIRAAMD